MDNIHVLVLLFAVGVTADLRCYVCTDCEYDYENTKTVCEDIRPTTIPPDEETTSTEEPYTTTSTVDPTTSDSSVPSSTDLVTSSHFEDISTISTMETDAPLTSSTEPTTFSTNPDGTTTPVSEPTSTPSDVDDFTPSSVNSDGPLSSNGESSSPTTSTEQITTTLNDVSELSTTESDVTTESTITTESVGDTSPFTLPSSDESDITQSTYSEETTLSTKFPESEDTSPTEETEITTLSTIEDSSPTEDFDIMITSTGTSVEDMEDPKLKFDEEPTVLMIDESKNVGSRYAFIRAVRAVKTDAEKIPRCVVTSYKDQNRTVVVRGCSFAQEDAPEKHCNTILDTGFTRNLSRCFVCNEDLCNSATKSISSSVIIVATIFMLFKIIYL